MAINFESVSTQTGIRTNLWDYTGADNLLVRFVPQGDGSFKFIFKHSGQAGELKCSTRNVNC